MAVPNNMDALEWLRRSGSTRSCGGAPTASASSRTGLAVVSLVGTVLAEQHDEWAAARHYNPAKEVITTLIDTAA